MVEVVMALSAAGSSAGAASAGAGAASLEAAGAEPVAAGAGADCPQAQRAATMTSARIRARIFFMGILLKKIFPFLYKIRDP
jgi:hypothetical protein